jgi:tRNA-specific 2-thiouridylase
LKLFDSCDIGLEKTKTCCALKDVQDAKSVANKLDIPHYTFNFKDRFRTDVIDKFINSYVNGLTPNPCIDCNRYIKFGALLKQAELLGMDYVATGHYARIEFDEQSGRYMLKKAVDTAKDQSYVLYNLTQKELSRLMFPMGDITKTDARNIAIKNNFLNANKPDSQDICFVPDGDYAHFIKMYINENDIPKGNFIDKDGNILGIHGGIINYTIGQRKGLGITFGKPMYVCNKDAKSNTVTLGNEDELYSDSLIAEDVNFISIDSLTSPIRANAKVRYGRKEQPAIISPQPDGKVLVKFDTPEKSVTPGQAVVFYEDDIVIGGGTISS